MSSLTAASTLTRRARCAQATPSSVGAVLNLHQQQTRSFRFSRTWIVHIDADHDRDICRRHRFARQRYADILHRHLSWDKNSFSRPSNPSKSSPYDYWRTDQSPSLSRNRWASSNIPNKTPGNPTGIRPGQNIEDAERAPLEHLLFGKQERRAKVTALDPADVTKTFKSYRSQFAGFQPPPLGVAQEPIFYDGPPPEAELKLYGKVKIDSEPWAAVPRKPAPAPRSQSVPDVVNALNDKHAEVLWNESNITGSGQGLNTSEYNDLDKYTPVVDPASDPVQDQPEEYKDLGRYVPIKHQEPDGKPRGQEESTEYEDLDKYGPVRSHEPDGKYKIDPDSEPAPEDLGKYEDGVSSHEPDGKYKPIQQASVSSEKLDKYDAAVRAHEPDGRYAPVLAEPNLDPAEIAEYSKPFLSHEPDGKYAEAYVRPSQDEAELARYEAFRSHEPDGKYAPEQYQAGYDPVELKTYIPFRSHEPDGKYAASHVAPTRDPAELKSYRAFRSHEPDGKYAASEAESDSEPVELDSYKAVRSCEPDGKYAANINASITEPTDLDEYQGGFRSNEPDGKYAPSAEDLNEGPDLGNHEAFTLEDSETSRTAQRQKAIPAAKNEAEITTEFRKVVQELMANPTAESALASQRSSSHQSSDGKETPKPKKSKRLTGQEKLTGAFHKSSTRQEQTRTETTPANFSEPVLYKILAYDPVMQAIDVAETTSVVPDSATPLSPAEVLLRISNPARFFPHFAPLQAQGFEIVSGSGDVLIFRKVREPVVAKEEQVASTKTVPASSPTSPVNPIDMTGGGLVPEYNVAAGRFASPTGFVNYDLPSEKTIGRYVPQGETFFSPGQRAEDMHERHSAWEEKQKKEKKKGSLLKRLAVSAAGVAGVSFGVAVLAEGMKNEGKGVKVVKKN
ncbi:uncharacterized protein PODANS_6_8030 [Podospora anserina S mat+]|uniref:Podospora anserina S mat+ genomic DNA chromosome 6, supercontig 2 n=1 Tax=Podospora anserina (strain S / ATCC MYA-4624 / DSM 980 / FGSC 10383) TaxID=515849 RepID=B2B434_PODAN|nr:uncharacterized protein PODANS_6_8030 [Podospora anserina S mat+]CAP71870.1 unnamed protein product [Podospora anserina S mat+]